MCNDEGLELSHPQYWDERYRSAQGVDQNTTVSTLDSFEWFRSFEQLRSFFEDTLPPSSSGCHILQLGCGNSSLTADLYALGYENQTSIDFSQVVIDAMRRKYSDLQTRWLVMDVRELQLPDSSVDVAIDKATLDAMIHGDPWDPPLEVRSNVGKYAEEVARVLKPGGKWIYITYRQRHFIEPLLERKDLWDLTVNVLSGAQGKIGYFSFIMKRHQALNTP